MVDSRRHHGGLEVSFYKNMTPDVLLKVCGECLKLFLLDEFEFEFIQSGKCPFCKKTDQRAQKKELY